MTASGDPVHTGTAIAVLVLYERPLEDAAPWPVLRSWLENGDARLRHCLVYDNSPVALARPASLPTNISILENPSNGGTAAAYRVAAEAAVRYESDWLLLLDQDTVLPFDYLRRASTTATRAPDVDVMVPRVRHDGQLISPATITQSGSVRPTGNPADASGITTAISSGVLIRRAEIAQIAFPASIWLDYVDHWMFLNLAKRSRNVAVIDADLSHDLSVRTPGKLTMTRVKTILAAESTFYAAIGGRARMALPLRRVLRAARYVMAGRPSLALTVLRATLHSSAQLQHD